MDDVSLDKLNARALAGISMMTVAGKASSSLDAFATWFLAGVGAGLSLVLSNSNFLIHLPANTIKQSLFVFSGGAIFCVAQRYLAAVVKAGHETAIELKNENERFPGFDFTEFFIEMLRPFPKFTQGYLKNVFNAIASGDLGVSGRFYIKMCVIQGFLILCQIIVLIYLLSELAWNFK